MLEYLSGLIRRRDIHHMKTSFFIRKKLCPVHYILSYILYITHFINVLHNVYDSIIHNKMKATKVVRESVSPHFKVQKLRNSYSTVAHCCMYC